MDDERGRVYLQRNGVRLNHDREPYICDWCTLRLPPVPNPNVERWEILHQRPEHDGHNDHLPTSGTGTFNLVCRGPGGITRSTGKTPHKGVLQHDKASLGFSFAR